MTGLLIAWVLFPLVLGTVSLGCGLLVEAASGIRLRGALLLPIGFAAIVVIAQLVTLSASTARFAPWMVAAVALAGLLITRPWRDRKPDWWPAAVGVGTFAVYAAPIVLSGSATFAGWIKLDDGATWLAMTDRLMTHGRSLAGLPVATHRLVLEGYLGSGYPVGAYLPFGVGGRLVGEDLAWLIQPYMSFAAVMLALGIYALVSRAIDSRPLRALTAFVGSQAALLYGYVLWGGLKEVVATALIALTAALVPILLERLRSPRAAVPLAVATAATVGSLSMTGGLIWLAAILLPGIALAIRRNRAAITLRIAVGFAVAAALLAIPAIVVAVKFFNSSRSILTNDAETVNLLAPLDFAQVFGIWLTGDFRFQPVNRELTSFFIALAGLATIAGIVLSLRRRAPEVFLYLVSGAVGAAVISVFGSPWVDAKAYAIASPIFLTTAVVGGALLLEQGRSRSRRLTVLGALTTLLLAVGVGWSNLLAYHDVRLAPRDQLEELATIGKRPESDGPAVVMEPGPYAAYYFLRRLAAEQPGGRRSRPLRLRHGGTLGKIGFADIDAFPLESILPYRTLILNRSATASRPPSMYRLVWEGRWYGVWRRPTQRRARVLAHLQQGTSIQPSTVPTCEAVRGVAAKANRPGDTLATVFRPPTILVSLSDTQHPRAWKTFPGLPGVIYPDTPGTLSTTVSIPVRGRYGVWLGGSFQRTLEIRIDGRSLGARRHQLSNNGVFTPFGDIDLTRGTHNVRLVYTAANLHPGSGGALFFYMGPLALGRHTANVPIERVAPANARSICGKSVDWVEAVRPRP